MRERTIKPGKLLLNNKSYMEKACGVIIEAGLNVGHIIFRKLCKDDKEKIEFGNQHLIAMASRFLEDEKWNLAIMVCDFGLSDYISSKCTVLEKLAFVFDKCIALKYLNKNKACLKLLDSTDTTAANPYFILAEFILRERYKEAGEYMASYMKKEYYDEIQFITFPLFKEFRKTRYFKTAFRSLYSREFNESKLITKLGDQIRQIPKELDGV